MSNLDQSLDAILAAKPRQARKARPAKAKAAGGVSKKAVTTTKSSTPKGPSNANKSTAPTKNTISAKIIVHGLPADVTEKQIKEYMASEIGPVARCELAYNAQGKSKGSATILFRKEGGQNYAQKACSLLNGRSVDSTGPKPLKMRVEIITEVPQPGLADRLGSLPKSVQQAVARGTKKAGAAASVPAGKNGGKGNVSAKKLQKTGPGRVKKVAKTASELDAEMEDYFEKKTA